MIPTHRLEGELLVITLPEKYEFQHCWNYFTTEFLALTAFKEAKTCVFDGSQIKNIGSLGMSLEILEAGESFCVDESKRYYLSGFSHEILNILTLLSDKKKFPRFFEDIEEIKKLP